MFGSLYGRKFEDSNEVNLEVQTLLSNEDSSFSLVSGSKWSAGPNVFQRLF
jgi:hypothetical protein